MGPPVPSSSIAYSSATTGWILFKFSTCTVFALERDFASLYTLWGELSQNELTNASVLSLPGEILKTD